MKVVCFIDNLGSGGAQRQLCTLAVHLQTAGMAVEMLTYHAGGFFGAMLERAGVPCRVAGGAGGLRRLLGVRASIAASRHEVVLAFLPMPCTYSELAGLFGRRWGLVVGERSTAPGAASVRVRARRALHRLADAVVTNSHANRLLIERTVPALAGRVSTVYNTVDFGVFAPSPLPSRNERELRVAIAASLRAVKNPRGWVEAIRVLRESDPMVTVTTDWFGGLASAPGDPDEREQVQSLVGNYGLQDVVRFHQPDGRIADRYRESHAVALPSLYEGLPNVVCEAMACGRPVAASAVSDAGNLVEHGVTGVLFDPRDPVDIAHSLQRLASLSDAGLAQMGALGRDRVLSVCDTSQIVAAYVRLLTAAAARQTSPVVMWPDAVPATARETVDRQCRA